MARQNRSLHHEALVHCVAALTALCRGDFDCAEALAQQAHAAARRVGAPQADSVYGLQMFCIVRDQGRLTEVQPVLQRMLLQAQPEGSFWGTGLTLLQAELGDADACRASYERLDWRAIDGLRGDARTLMLLAFAAECCVYLEDSDGAACLLGLLSPLAATPMR